MQMMIFDPDAALKRGVLEIYTNWARDVGVELMKPVMLAENFPEDGTLWVKFSEKSRATLVDSDLFKPYLPESKSLEDYL